MKKTFSFTVHLLCFIFFANLQVSAQNSQKTQNSKSRIEDSYTANEYILYNKSGDSTGYKGRLKASSSAITLKTDADNFKISFKINETPAFQMLKGVNGDPTLFGQNSGYSRFVGAGSLAFYTNSKGLSSPNDLPPLFIAKGGQIGINNTSPDYKLEIVTNGPEYGFVMKNNSDQIKCGIGIGTGYAAMGTISSSPLYFVVNALTAGAFDTNMNFGIGTSFPTTRLHVEGSTYISGQVGIATQLTNISTENQGKYNLFVGKGVLSEDFALGPRSSWADYVFDKNYKLKDLTTTANYIKSNGRLPDMPSAEEIKKDGYSLHDMNVKLLTKIEELTLHAIAQEKTIESMKQQLSKYEELERKIDALNKKIDQKK